MQNVTFTEIARATLKICPITAVGTLLAFLYLSTALFAELPSPGYALGAFLYGFLHVASKGYRIQMRSYAEHGINMAISRSTLAA